MQSVAVGDDRYGVYFYLLCEKENCTLYQQKRLGKPSRFCYISDGAGKALPLLTCSPRLRCSSTEGANLKLALLEREGGTRRVTGGFCELRITSARTQPFPREYLCNSEPSSWGGDYSSRFPRLWVPILLRTCRTCCKAPLHFPHG